MSLFTSERERRLWRWTVVVVVGIYSTLGLTGTLVGIVGGQGAAAIGFLLCMALVAATAVAHGLRTRPGGAEIAVGLGITAAYLMVFLRMTLAERSHLIEYGVVAVFIHAALLERTRQGRRVRAPVAVAIVATTALGVVDECVQLLVPKRVFDPVDIVFNFLAATMSVGASVALTWARQRFPRGGGSGRP